MPASRRFALPAAGLAVLATTLTGWGQAWADPAPHTTPDTTSQGPGAPAQGPLGPNSPGDPTAATEYFARHLNTYHFGHRLVGFDAAADNFTGWLNYHFNPTGLETVSRGVAPSHAPEVEGDTWVPTDAPEYQNGSEHSTSHSSGQPLNLPVYPGAAPEYLGKWASGNPSPQEAAPAVQEAARRATVPVEPSPPVEGDHHSDRRPGPQAEQPVPVLPAEANDQGQALSRQGGAVAESVFTPVAGPGEAGYGESGEGGSGHDGSGHADSPDDAPTDEGSSDEGSTDEGSSDEGSTDEGSTDPGSASPLAGVLG